MHYFHSPKLYLPPAHQLIYLYLQRTCCSLSTAKIYKYNYITTLKHVMRDGQRDVIKVVFHGEWSSSGYKSSRKVTESNSNIGLCSEWSLFRGHSRKHNYITDTECKKNIKS